MFSVFLLLILAVFIIFLSIKLSSYADYINNNTALSSLVVGGFLLAITTSLPEFFTALSAIYINNVPLAIGNIFGGNMFNIFMIIVFDLVFIKAFILKRTDKMFGVFIALLLLINLSYIFLNFFSVKLIILPTIIIMIYLIYVKLISKLDLDTPKVRSKQIPYIKSKFFIISVTIIVLSIALTLHTDNILHDFPMLSASAVGAYLLGICTSLPEIVMTFNLIKLKNYNLALAGLLGANFFNLLIIAIIDLFFGVNVLQSIATPEIMTLIIFGSMFYIIVLLKRELKWYKSLSVLAIVLYIVLFYLQFIV